MVRTRREYIPFTWPERLYVYAIHGYVTEVMFTALWDFVVNRNWKFHGVTSIWSMPIYGFSGLILEQMVMRMQGRVPFLVRMSIYTLWTLIWEFSTGYILKQFDACPWDYSNFDGAIMGLITLEYVPMWFVGNILCETVILKCTKSLYWGPEQQRPLAYQENDRAIPNGDVKHDD